MSSNATTSLAKGTGWRKLGEATRVPSRMRSVARAAAVSVGTAANQGESRNDRQARWSYVQAWSNPSASARRHNSCACGHRCSGRMTTPNRITGTIFAMPRCRRAPRCAVPSGAPVRGAVGRPGSRCRRAPTRAVGRPVAVPSGAPVRCRRAPRSAVPSGAQVRGAVGRPGPRCRRAPRSAVPSGAPVRGAVGRPGPRCRRAPPVRGAVGRPGARCRRAPRSAVPSGAGALGPSRVERRAAGWQAAVVTVVLVHGVPETTAVWDHLRAELGRDDVVALALPGFGSARPEGFGATKEDYVAWLVGELEHLADQGPIDLVGHDWGGGLVIRLVSTRPELVRSWVSGRGQHRPRGFRVARLRQDLADTGRG